MGGGKAPAGKKNEPLVGGTKQNCFVKHGAGEGQVSEQAGKAFHRDTSGENNAIPS